MPHAGRDDFKSNFCRFPHEELQRAQQHVHFSKLLHIMVGGSERADLRGLIRMTGVRPCPCGHSSTLEGPWSTCHCHRASPSTQRGRPSVPVDLSWRRLPSPLFCVGSESAAQQSEVKLGDWCAGCVVACPTPSVSDMLH